MVRHQEKEEDWRERCNAHTHRRRPTSDVCAIVREVETCLIVVAPYPSPKYIYSLHTD